MAIYHFHIGVVKRSNEHSSVAASAYFCGGIIKDERTGKLHDFSKKKGVIYSELFLPKFAPEWMSKRELLWNSVEKMEKRKDAQVARVIDIALPRELNAEQNWELAKDFIISTFVDLGMCADVSFHNDNPKNPHIHVLLTMRKIDKETQVFHNKKERLWNKTEYLKKWREDWSRFVNEKLEKSGLKSRIDHLSHKERKISKIPTIHMGRAYFALKYRGKSLDRVKKNEDIKRKNLNLSKLSGRFGFFSKDVDDKFDIEEKSLSIEMNHSLN